VDAYLHTLLARLGDADPIEVLQSTPEHLARLLERAGADAFDAALRAGGWSGAQVLAHLADVELGMGFRLRQAVAGVREAQDFDQDRWARHYRRVDVSLSLEMFRAARAWNLACLAAFDLDDWLSEYRHPVRGMESVDVLVRSLAGHDLRHLDGLAEAFA
jgi:hypothetical protein